VSEHAGGSLHQGLHDHGGDLLLVPRQHPRHRLGVAGLRLMDIEQKRPIGGLKAVDPPDRHGAERVAVVGVAEADELGPPHVLPASLPPVLEGDLQRDLGGRRAGVRVEDPGQARRRDLDQAGGQLRGARMRESEQGGMSDPLELVAHRPVDEGVAMAMHVAPQR
jgi:hypothetical protein